MTGALHPDRLFPADPATRAVARQLFQLVENAPILSPHGHTDPRWWGRTRHSPTPPNCS